MQDLLGFPVCRITPDFTANDKLTGAFIQDKLAQWCMEAGAIVVE